jgi:hypothetical protein
MLNTKGMRFPIDVILVCIRWYAAYPLSYRHLEEMMEERGVEVDHSTINRWTIRFLPLLEKVFRKHKLPVGVSWRMDETYIKVNCKWKHLYRAVDKAGKTIDFLLTAERDKEAAMRFFKKAMQGVVAWRWSRSRPALFRPAIHICRFIHKLLHVGVGHVRLRGKAALTATFLREIWAACVRHPDLNRAQTSHTQRVAVLLDSRINVCSSHIKPQSALHTTYVIRLFGFYADHQ